MNKSYFSKFYKTPACIYEKVGGDDYNSGCTLKKVKDILCDFQDISEGIVSNEYGIRDTKTAKIFFDTDTAVLVNQYAVINGITYLITRVDNRDMGSMAVLARRDAV